MTSVAAVVVKRNDVVHWRGQRIGRVDRTRRGVMFAPDKPGTTGVIHASTIGGLREAITRAVSALEDPAALGPPRKD